MEYQTPEAAQNMSGLRLALTAGVPAPYSMSARAIFDHHNIAYTPVLQSGGGRNEALVTWTKHRNAPVAVYEQEAPRTGWLEILHLAERLGSGPSLIPVDLEQRMQMFAIANELLNEGGLIWNLRLLMLGMGGPERAAAAAKKNPMYQDYGYSEAAKEAALARSQEILTMLTEHARRQPGHYLIGDQFTALDIYWVYFSNLCETIDDQRCPMPDFLRQGYAASSAALGGCDANLIQRRDWVLANHLSSPMTF